MTRFVLNRRPASHLPTSDRARLTLSTIDTALLLLMVTAAFLLGCQQLSDADIWWHLRAGQWILQNRTVPALDPFSFASADRTWVDIHWLFQLIIATAFTAGGVPAVILTTAAVCASLIWLVLALSDRRPPGPIVVACWLPALLLMSARFTPRPEVFSLLAMALYLTVLSRTDVTPQRAWLLPLVQIFWVNTHGLFVLGPIILVAFMTTRLLKLRRRPTDAGIVEGRLWWAHVGGAALVTGIACLANPYGLRGALFPLELYPKITVWGGLYKTYIIEFGDLRELAHRRGPTAASDIYLVTECFLLWMIPPSFIIPAVGRAGGAIAPNRASMSPLSHWS